MVAYVSAVVVVVVALDPQTLVGQVALGAAVLIFVGLTIAGLRNLESVFWQGVVGVIALVVVGVLISVLMDPHAWGRR